MNDSPERRYPVQRSVSRHSDTTSRSEGQFSNDPGQLRGDGRLRQDVGGFGAPRTLLSPLRHLPPPPDRSDPPHNGTQRSRRERARGWHGAQGRIHRQPAEAFHGVTEIAMLGVAPTGRRWRRRRRRLSTAGAAGVEGRRWENGVNTWGVRSKEYPKPDGGAL